MVQTQVIWTLPIDPAAGNLILQKSIEMGNLETQAPEHYLGPNPNEETWNRFWVDEASANQWITFIIDFNPVSATIIP